MEIDLESIYIPSSKVVARKIEDELIIIPIQNGLADLDDSMFSLNATGQAVWEKLAPNRTVSFVCSSLADEFNASFEEVKNDVLLLLNQLFQKKLIVKIEKG
nr:PqqD family protein [Desulfobacula sp.]